MLLLLVSLVFADTTIGKCRFIGERPTNVFVSSGMMIHHVGDMKKVSTSGSLSIWNGSGPVWVVFSDSTAYSKNAFLVNGSLQTCFSTQQ